MTDLPPEARKAAWDAYMGYVQLVDEGEALPATEYAVDAALAAALPHIEAAERTAALTEARGVITQYLSTAEKWRYDRVVIAFGIMLGELPEDTPMPEAVADYVAEAEIRADERKVIADLCDHYRASLYADASSREATKPTRDALSWVVAKMRQEAKTDE